MLVMSPQFQIVIQQAIQAFQDGNYDSAGLLLKRVLQVDVNNLPALHILGLIKASQSNYKEAANYLARAAKIHPKDASIQYNLAKALADSGNHKDALIHNKKAVTLAPNNPEAWVNYGKTAASLGLLEDALVWFGNALSLKADYAEAALNIGATLKELERYEEAVVFAEKALSINPNLAEAWINKGVALGGLRRYEEAITHYDKALSLKPDFAEGWSNKGVTLNELKRFDEATSHYDKALSLKPDYAKGWYNKGITLNELKRFDEAVAHFDKAISLKPEMDWIYGELIHTKIKICSWSGLTESIKILSQKVIANEKVVQPLSLIPLSDVPLLQKKCAEIHIKHKYPKNDLLGPILKNLRKEKIRIGYFSADFKNHPVAFLIAQLFEIHDKSKFETYAFSLVGASDEMRKRLIKAFDHFINVDAQSDAQIAQLARDLGIDIAIDLTGHTKDSRTGIFSYRAAPIQVNYLGYPGTMGSDYIDYIIADKTLIPPESQSFYSEKVAYLPNSYQANDRKRVISDRIFTRQELGLPEKGFVFCCFNNNFKLLPATFDGWVRILKAVEGSVLWLFQDNIFAVNNLKLELSKKGVNPARLIFAECIEVKEHLARQRLADLFLDTLPYNAHTTASDALWTGLPVLTLMGESFASRVASSLLNAIELPELITTTQEEYEATAIELAMNPGKLLAIKQKLANNRLSAPLFDTPLFTRNIETAYTKMHERYLGGLEPDHILI
jgi:protein O-GlcNAc transferase